jgi:hypothetical protein
MKFLEDCKKKFTEHPDKAGETYLIHLFYATRMAGTLMIISCLLLLHGIFPFTCQTLAGDKLVEITKEIEQRRAECRKNAELS